MTRTPPKKVVATALSLEVFEKVERIATENRWNLSQALRYLVEDALAARRKDRRR